MSKQKTLAAVLSVVLVAALAIGGTLAYLQDTGWLNPMMYMLVWNLLLMQGTRNFWTKTWRNCGRQRNSHRMISILVAA